MKLTPVRWLHDMPRKERVALARKLTRPSGVMKGWLTRPNRCDLVLTATVHGKAIGVGMLRMNTWTEPTAKGTFSLYVKKAYRFKGIGKKLVLALRDAAVTQWGNVCLTTRPPTAGAGVFFKKVLE